MYTLQTNEVIYLHRACQHVAKMWGGGGGEAVTFKEHFQTRILESKERLSGMTIHLPDIFLILKFLAWMSWEKEVAEQNFHNRENNSILLFS